MRKKDRLAYQLTRMVVFIALILGFLTSCFQVIVDYFETRKQQIETIYQITRVMEKSFANAVLYKDIRLINDLIVGLFNYNSIFTVIVLDKKNTELVSASKGLRKIPGRWLSDIIFGEMRMVEIQLEMISQKNTTNSDVFMNLSSSNKKKFDPNVGTLKVYVDNYFEGVSFIKRAGTIVVIGLLRNFILALLLLLLFKRYLVTPLTEFRRKLSSIDAKNPHKAQLTVPPKHEKNEFGLLVNGTNMLLDTIDSYIERRRINEETLRESEEKLRLQGMVLDQISDQVTITDLDGRILYVNQASKKLVELNSDELTGQMTTKFGEDSERGATQKEILENTLRDGTWQGEVINYAADGSDKIMHCRTQVVRNEAGEPFCLVGIATNISELKQAENQIKASLKEKETLLHEIHHRVKNNMQVINSLLKLQANNIEDKNLKGVLKESQSRVYAMSAVHETLHGSDKLSEIDLKSYLSKITTSIFQTYATNHYNVNLKSDIVESPISIKQAYPLGLIVNELISNSLKYAFPKEKQGEISVSMKILDKELELIVKDDGVGIPNDLDWKNSSSLGFKLVRTLVENQLEGSIDLDNTNGTKFTIKFNIES